MSYISKCNQNLTPSFWAVNLNSLAIEGKSGDLLEDILETKAKEDQVTINTACVELLLKIVLLATMNSPRSMEYIGKIYATLHQLEVNNAYY